MYLRRSHVFCSLIDQNSENALLNVLLNDSIDRNHTGAAGEADCYLCADGFYCPNGTENAYGIPCEATYECPLVGTKCQRHVITSCQPLVGGNPVVATCR